MLNNPHPHRERRSTIQVVLLILLGFALGCAVSCSPQKGGCYGTKGMSGYGILEQQESKQGISVIYRDKRGEWALDYLCKMEYDSLVNHLASLK